MSVLDALCFFQDSVGTAGDDSSATTTAEITSKSIDTRKIIGTTDKKGQGAFDGGHPGYLNVRCKTLGQAGTLTVNLKDSADDSTFATVLGKLVASADNVANATVLKIALPPGLRRFIAVSVTNGTSGTNVYNAWISAS